MITGKLPITTDIAALDTEQSNIWKRLTIIKIEAWFSTVSAIAREYRVMAKLESRYMKSAIICDRTGRRIGRIWHLDENLPIYFDRKQWITHFEAANTINEAIEKIARTA